MKYLRQALTFGMLISLSWSGIPNVWATSAERANAQPPASQKPAELEGVGITEKLGEQVELEKLIFTNEEGKEVPLSSYFAAKKPVILTMAYYNCPALCGLVLNGLMEGLKKMDWVPGNQFQVVNVSMDPKETAELAAQKKANYVQAYGKPEVAAGWHFLVGQENQIKSLASQIGFGYRYDENKKEYLHGAGIFVLTPEGKLSRILYGIQYGPTDLKLSLLEASNGKVGTILDRIILFCYSYDPQLRKYSMVLTRVMQAGALVSTAIILLYLLVFWWRQRGGESSV